jgi:hypothetical protein
MKVLKIISERVMKAGYVLRRELCESPCKGDPPYEWTMAYTPRGEYIGDPKDARFLCVTRGIYPETKQVRVRVYDDFKAIDGPTPEDGLTFPGFAGGSSLTYHDEIQQTSVCCIGFSSKDGKWYGWSHRAIFGFKIGSTCKKGDCHYTPKSSGGKGAWKAKTIADARQMAIDFAEGVS